MTLVHVRPYVFAALGTFASLTAVSCGKGDAKSAETGASQVAIAVSPVAAVEEPIARFIRVTGTLTAEERADVAAETAGRVVATPVERGSPVAQGAELVKLSTVETEASLKEAEANAEADKARREAVEARNHAESLVHQVDKNLKEHGDKLGAQEKGEAEAAIAAAKSALEGTDVEAVKQATERLSQAAMKIGEAMYKAEQAQAGAAGAAGAQPGGKPDDKVVDAEFEEVDDKKKG